MTLPEWVDPDAWAGFVEMRRAMRKVPFTDRAAAMILRDLAAIRDAGHCPNAALDQSTLLGWRGVWPARAKDIPRAIKPAADQTREYLMAEAARQTTPMPAEVRERLRRVS